MKQGLIGGRRHSTAARCLDATRRLEALALAVRRQLHAQQPYCIL